MEPRTLDTESLLPLFAIESALCLLPVRHSVRTSCPFRWFVGS